LDIYPIGDFFVVVERIKKLAKQKINRNDPPVANYLKTAIIKSKSKKVKVNLLLLRRSN